MKQPEFILECDKTGNPTESDLQIACLVVLLWAAKSNSIVCGEEFTQIVASMGGKFGLPDAEIGSKLETAEFLVRTEAKEDQFFETLREKFDTDQRIAVLSMAWRVIAADGDADRMESAFAADLRKKLGLTLEQSALAGKSAEAEIAAFAFRREISKVQSEE